MKAVAWHSWGDVKADFGKACLVGNCVVFNIGGNKYRLVTRILYASQKVFVLKIMTHQEYDEDNWKEECDCFAEPPSKPASATDTQSLRTQLAESSLRLQHILDPQWRDYLALPSEVYAEGRTPNSEAFARCLNRYQAVTGDARYQSLSAGGEFRETHALLLRYERVVAGRKSSTLRLPPPPR